MVASVIAIGLTAARAQFPTGYNGTLLTPVGVSLTDPTTVSAVTAGLTDVALGTSAVYGPAGPWSSNPAYFISLGGPGIAVATSDDNDGSLFAATQVNDGLVAITNIANWNDGAAYNPVTQFPFLPSDNYPSGETPFTTTNDWLVIDFNTSTTLGLVVLQGRFPGRDAGLYTFLYTTDPSPVSQAGSTWHTIGSYEWTEPTSLPGGLNVLPRLAFAFPAIPNVTGIQLTLSRADTNGVWIGNPNGLWATGIQQLEAYGPFTSAPVITQGPQSTNAYVGLSLVLSVTAINGTGFQWYKNGVPVGPNNSTYVVSADAQTTDSGTYSVVVSNNVTTAASGPASVNVTLPPTPALFQVNAVTIAYTPNPVYNNTLQQCPTLGTSQFVPYSSSFAGVNSTWFTTVNGSTVTATPMTSSNEFFRLVQSPP